MILICLITAYILQSGMLWPSLILAVALTTARADTFSNLNSSCVVREGPCDINVWNEGGLEKLTSTIGTVNTTTLQQCASHCEVQVILYFPLIYIHCTCILLYTYVHIIVFRFLNQKYLGQRGLYCFPIKPGLGNMSTV